jgi:hypothetical protein
MPNRPITAIRKSKPLQQLGEAEGHAQLAGHRVHADGGQREAQHHRREVLIGGSLLMPTKLQKVSICTAKNSAGRT